MRSEQQANRGQSSGGAWRGAQALRGTHTAVAGRHNTCAARSRPGRTDERTLFVNALGCALCTSRVAFVALSSQPR